MGQQRVRGDVERNAEEDVGRALVELAGQPAFGDVELEERVARWKRHVLQIRDIPGRDDVPAGIRIGLDRCDHVGQLVDVASVWGGPGPPLVAVDRAQVAVGIRPLVPDGDAVGVQPGQVGVAAQEPQQLAEHRPGVHPLSGEQREALAQVEAQLVTKHAQRAGASAVGLLDSGIQNPPKQIKILGISCVLAHHWCGQIAFMELKRAHARPLSVLEMCCSHPISSISRSREYANCRISYIYRNVCISKKALAGYSRVDY